MQDHLARRYAEGIRIAALLVALGLSTLWLLTL